MRSPREADLQESVTAARCVRSTLTAVLAVGLFATAAPAGWAVDEVEQARAERKRLQLQIGDVTAELERLSVRITDARVERKRLEADVAALQVEAGEAAEALTTQAVSAYTLGRLGSVGGLFGAVGPGQAVDRARMLAGMGRREQEEIERAAVARAALASRRADLDDLVEALEADQDRTAVLRADLDAAFATAQVHERDVESRRARQREVSRDRQRGTYACPLAMPYNFRDTWGAPRSGGRRHKGVDMFAPMGADVYAITAGTISRQSTSRLGGLGLYLSGDDGNVYYYAHLKGILPGYTPGRRVQAGELVARNGDSGNARGGAPHIHLEVRPGGTAPVSPYPFAAAACF
ncbi:hypothetical protein BH23ACT7_BH23ACT7_09430 [soil metagenome]